jgi:PAS domain S-box-containing protein
MDEPLPNELMPMEVALEGSPDCVALVDLEGHLLHMNSPGAWIMGIESDSDHRWTELWPNDAIDVVDCSLESARSGRTSHFVVQRATARGSARWWDVVVSPVFGPAGAPEHLLCVARDVTELKSVESSLRTALSMNEALLAEVNHRVKNNLSIIAGLLRLQASRSESATQRHLLYAASKINAVAELHGCLSDSALHNRVDAGAYVERVASGVIHALSAQEQLTLRSHCERGIYLGVGHALSLALIAAELVTNAVRHAFSDGVGTIEVALSAKDADLVLRIDDDGRGLPADFEACNAGLGMQIVDMLVRQLRGKLNVRAEEAARGAHFEILFSPQDSTGGKV